MLVPLVLAALVALIYLFPDPAGSRSLAERLEEAEPPALMPPDAA